MAGIKKAKAARGRPSKEQRGTTPKNQKNKASSTTNLSTAFPTAPSTLSNFLALPPETRNNIYRYALISDEPVKVQFESTQRGRGDRCYRFTMLPGLATVSKQVRLESQRIFLENKFEITPEMLKPRDLAPVIALQTMHRRLGAEIRTLRVNQEAKKRCDGDLFQLKGCFTVSKVGTKLSVSNEAYSATYIGRTPRGQAVPYTFVCGCMVKLCAENLAGLFHKRRRDAGDIFQSSRN
jgi:hypothetical protein